MLHSIRQQIWETQQWPQDWKRWVFIPTPKKGTAKEYTNYYTTALISRAGKFMLKILQARLQQYVNWELLDVWANIHWIIEKAREFQTKHLFLLHWLCWSLTTNCRKFLKKMGIPDHLTCLLRNLYAGQEVTVKTRRGTTDLFKFGKGVQQGCMLLSCLFK